MRQKKDSIENIGRRDVIKGIAASAAAIAATAAVPGLVRTVSANEPIRVGVLLSLTGAWTAYGYAQLHGLQLAADEINEAGGVLGRKVELIVADTKTKPRVVAQQANRLIRSENVDFIAGTTSSADRNAAAPVVTSANKVLLYPTYYEGQEQEYHPGVCNKNIFMFGPEPTQQVWPWLEQMVNKLGKKIFMIGNDYSWPRVTNKVTKSKIDELDAEVVGEEYVPFGTPAYDSIIRKIRRRKPDFLFLTLTGSDTVNFRRQFASTGIRKDVPIWSVDDEEVITAGLGPDTASGDYASFDYFMSLDHPNNKSFISKLKEKHGDDVLMNTIGACQYNSMRMAAMAMEKNGEVSTASLIEGLEGLTFDGAPHGSVTMRAMDHQAILPSYLATVNDGWSNPEGMFTIIEGKEAVKPMDARCNFPIG